jgi:transposase
VEALAVDGEGLGRSRGGLTSKIHLAVDGRGLPMSVIVTPGQAGDNPELTRLLDQVNVAPMGPGRPRKRPRRVIADRAYSHPTTRRALRARAIAFTCPERSDQIAWRKRQGQAGGRPPAFDPAIYKRRNVVERCFSRLKQFRGLATRYAKRVAYYRAEVVIATIALWLRDSQDTP